MPATSKHRHGIRWLTIASIGLSAAAGYWCGTLAWDAPGGDERRVISSRGEREWNAADGDSDLTAVEVVREAANWTIEGRRQWRLICGFSEDELKAAMQELGDAGQHFINRSDLPLMLFYRWGELDPEAADAAAKAMFPKMFSGSRMAVITAWIKQGGGVAAWNAVRDETEMWDCTRSVQGEVAEMLVASLSDQDDATAFREVRRLDDDNCEVADVLCRARARKASETPESRAAFLAAAADHPEPYVLQCALVSLFREWAARDVEAARAGAMAMPIPENERRSVLYWIDSAGRDKERDAENAAAGAP